MRVLVLKEDEKRQFPPMRAWGVKPPREFVLVDRAAVGLGAVFLRLDAQVNWYRLFNDLVGDFDVSNLESRQADALGSVDLVRPDA